MCKGAAGAKPVPRVPAVPSWSLTAVLPWGTAVEPWKCSWRGDQLLHHNPGCGALPAAGTAPFPGGLGGLLFLAKFSADRVKVHVFPSIKGSSWKVARAQAVAPSARAEAMGGWFCTAGPRSPHVPPPHLGLVLGPLPAPWGGRKEAGEGAQGATAPLEMGLGMFLDVFKLSRV